MKKNDTWFITGGSKGIGLELAKALVARGSKVALTTRSAGAVKAALGESVLALEVDLLDEKSVQAAVQATVARFERIDVVVNNAGYGQMGAVEEVSDEEARRNFDVNVFGALNVLRATLPVLRAQRSGHVFNVASIGGFVGGFSGWGVYCATKFALAGITEALHADLADLHVRATVVYPGYFRTEFLAPGSRALPEQRIGDYEAARASEALHTDTIAGHQPGDPAKLARALIGVAEQSDPPLHFFVGPDAFDRAKQKLARVTEELERYAAITRSTNFDA